MNINRVEVGARLAYFPPQRLTEDNLHFPAVVESKTKAGRVRVRLLIGGEDGGVGSTRGKRSPIGRAAGTTVTATTPQRILAVLADGPTTIRELADSLGESSERGVDSIKKSVYYLCKRGLLQKRTMFTSSGRRTKSRPLLVWELR